MNILEETNKKLLASKFKPVPRDQMNGIYKSFGNVKCLQIYEILA